MLKKLKIAGLILVVIVCSSVLLFTGCKRDDRTTLRVLFYLEASAPNAVADANSWFSTFERNNPGVRVERENLFDEPYHDKLRAYAAAGDMPDVMYVWPSGRSGYLHDQRLLKDLTPFINRDGLKNLYIPLATDPSQQQAGYQAMLPQGVTNTHVFLVNMEILNEVGLQPARTYDELVAQVPVLRAAGYETVLIPAQSDWVMQSCLFSMVAGRFMGTGWEARVHGGQANFTDSEFVAALDFIARLYTDGVISRSALGVDYGDGPGMFANNRGAYYIDGDWRVGAFITDSSTGQALIPPARQSNIRISVFPDIPGARINSSGSSILGTGYAMAASLPAGSEKERLAWELVKFLVGKETSERRLETGAVGTPSRVDIDYNAITLEPMQVALANLGGQLQAATSVIDGVFPSEVYLPINIALMELAMGTQTAQQAANAIQNAFNTWKASQ